jgi:alcohol dehydrogenase (cytochrome c)
MTTAFRNLIFILAVLVAPGAAMAQWFDSTKGLDPQQIFNPPPDAWLTYSGDYSGRRYSPLTQLNQSNVKNLSLAWATHVVVLR